MITNSKIFGQAKPAAATPATLCTIGVGKEGQGILTMCNQSSSIDQVRVAFVPSGGSLGVTHYVLYDTEIPARGVAEKSFDLAAGAIISVYSTFGNVSFCADGLEVTV